MVGRFKSLFILFKSQNGWKDDNERLCAVKRRTAMGWIPSLAGFEPGILWSEVRSSNPDAFKINRFWKEQPFWSNFNFKTNCSYRIYHIYSDRQAWANSIDPDETPQTTLFATHPAILTQHRVVNCTGSNFRTYMVRSWGVRILRVNTV